MGDGEVPLFCSSQGEYLLIIPSYVSYYFENVNSAPHIGCGCCCGVLGVGNAAWAQGKQHLALYLPFAHGDF